MAPHSSTLAWKSPWTEELGGPQSMASLTVEHDWVTSLSLFTFMHWRRKWQPSPVFLPGESQGWGAWRAAISGVTQSRTRLKRLSSMLRSGIFCWWHSLSLTLYLFHLVYFSLTSKSMVSPASPQHFSLLPVQRFFNTKSKKECGSKKKMPFPRKVVLWMSQIHFFHSNHYLKSDPHYLLPWSLKWPTNWSPCL